MYVYEHAFRAVDLSVPVIRLFFFLAPNTAHFQTLKLEDLHPTKTHQQKKTL